MYVYLIHHNLDYLLLLLVHIQIRVKVNKKALRVLWGKPLHFLFVPKNRSGGRLSGREVNSPLDEKVKT